MAIRALFGEPVLLNLVYGVNEQVHQSFQTKIVGKMLFSPSRTFRYALAVSSGKFGWAVVRILASSRARIPMARPNEPNLLTDASQTTYICTIRSLPTQMWQPNRPVT